ncbi:hypothetical protein [Streptomyces roseoverticillatus]|uniref:Uncharacterized protein n=1 Tax=Streptomyces roseoverticillatus TaxID=66429 RepID=A0ABV3IXA8_9ACTN
MASSASAARAQAHVHAGRRAAGAGDCVRPGQALQYTTVNDAQFLPFPSRTPVGSVRPAVRSARKKYLVHEYDVLARDGSPLRIVYIRQPPVLGPVAKRRPPSTLPH